MFPFGFLRYYNDYLDCVQNTVISFCGDEAGAWQREMLSRLLQPMLAHSFCELHEDGGVFYGGEQQSYLDNGKKLMFIIS